MRRRKFIALAGGAAAWSGVALAQKLKKPARLAFLFFGSPSSPYDRSLIDAFRQGLRQAGLVENQDIVLDVVWVTDPEQAVRDAIQHGADMLIPCGSSTSVVAKRHGSTIPIVFVSVGDPVGMGLVESLSRPGGNVTGFSDILGELSGKLVDVALELSKPQTTVDYLWHTNWPDGQNRYQLTEQAAQSRGVRLRHRGIGDIAEINDALAAMRQGGAMTVVIQPSPLTYGNRQRIIDLAMNYRLGTIFAFPVAAREGALVGYGPDYVHMYRKVPFYVEHVLKGMKPADLPIERPNKVELVVNLKTAKAQGFEVPLPLLIRADELID